VPTLRQSVVSSVSRLYPFYSGCGSFANHSVVQRLAGVSDETVWARVTGGEVLAPLGDYVGRAAFYAGDLDRKITWICSRLIRPGDTVFDIGANIGIMTVLMAKLTGSSGHVHSFEPNPSLVRLLRQVIERNALANVKLHAFALGREAGQLELRVPKLNAGSGSLVLNRDVPDCDVVPVPVRQLSVVAAEEGVRRLRLIKIDVEGFEVEVLSGARSLLQSVRPQAIVFELNQDDQGELCEHPIVKLLLEFDYGFLAIPRSLTRMKLQRFDPRVAGRSIGHDVLALARGEQYQDLLSRVNASQ